MIEHMNYNGTVPSGVEVVREGSLLRVRFDFEKVAHEATEDREAYSEVICQLIDTRETSYGGLVSAIINDKYSEDSYQAVLSNYELAKDAESELAPEKREEYINEYKAFQAWRKHAKETAATVIEILNS